MTFLETYLLVAAGIVLSFIFPVLRKALQKYFPMDSRNTLVETIKKFGLLAIFSALTAILIIALADKNSQIYTDWRAALLLGYAWDSTVQKFSQ